MRGIDAAAVATKLGCDIQITTVKISTDSSKHGEVCFLDQQTS